MATGPETYAALRTATQELPSGSEFVINILDVYDLAKLEPDDLIDRGYDPRIAKEVSSALLNRNCQPLGESMGLRLLSSHDAAR